MLIWFRLWGKIQILGLGASIKILLTAEEDLSVEGFLTRQEVVALINTLNQFSKSVEFTSDVLSHNVQQTMSVIFSSIDSSYVAFAITIVALVIASYPVYIFIKAKAD